MRKQILLIVIVFLLLAFAIYISVQDRNSTLVLSSDKISIRKPEIISRINIIQNNDTLVLIKNNHAWLVNHTHPAREKAINEILKVFSRLEYSAPVSKKESEQALAKLSEEGRTFEFYNSEKPIKKYRITGSANGRFMQAGNHPAPFIYNIPGKPDYDLFISFPPDMSFWTKNILIHYSPVQIASIDLIYPENMENSISILNPSEGEPAVYPAGSDTALKHINKQRIRDYLFFFTNIKYEPVRNEQLNNAIRTVNNNPPFFIMTIKERSGRENRITGYEKYMMGQEDKRDRDLNRFWAVTGKSEKPVILRYLDIDPLLVTKNYFLKN